MHDIDRTQLEWEQYEHEAPGHEVLQESEAEYGEVPLHETHEMELATELLEVTNEAELENFLGNVFKAVGSTIGQFARSDTGRALTGMLRNAARDALPRLGGAIGNWVAPGRDAAIGTQLAQQAGSLLGLELEGLSPPDQEFEAARQFVRFAGDAYANAAAAPRGAPPLAVAQQAAAAAAQRFAPGLAPAVGPQEKEAEYRSFRGYGRRAVRQPAYGRGVRRKPRDRYGYPVYGGWARYPVAPPVALPAYAADVPPEEPPLADAEPASPADSGGDEEYGSGYAGSNGYAASARNGRWVRRGRVVIVYGA